VRDRLVALRDVRLHDPAPTPPALIDQYLEGVVCRLARAKPERARQEVRLKDRLDHRLERGLHDAVADCRNRQRPLLLGVGLRDEDPTRGERSVAAGSEIRGQLVEQAVNAVALDISEGLAIDAGRAAVAAHLAPRLLQDVPAVDFVVERVEAS